MRYEVLASLEKRWAAADQDPFIAAVILNPFLHADFLAHRHIALTPIGLCNMLKRLHSRVFRMDVDTEFQAAFMDYFNKREEFSPESMALIDWMEMAKKNVSHAKTQIYVSNRDINQGQEVNPVDIWEGIDTCEETGRNRLTKLAIHILSIVTNSAGCERAFSHMGLVHTSIRSKLRVEKVRKTTMVGMDIKRSHQDASLLRLRAKRNFAGFTSKSEAVEGIQVGHASSLNSDQPDLEQENELMDFDQLSEHLIAGAASAGLDIDVGDDYNDPDELPADIVIPARSGSLMITIPPINSATLSPQATPLKKTCIPLEILFEYPADTDLPSETMNSFWKGGIENLKREMDAYEILANGEASDGIQPEIPTTVDVI